MLRSDGFKETRAGGYNCDYCTVHYLNVALVLAEKGGGKAEHWPVLEEKGCSPRNKSGMDGSRKNSNKQMCFNRGESLHRRGLEHARKESDDTDESRKEGAAAEESAAAAAISNMLLLLRRLPVR